MASILLVAHAPLAAALKAVAAHIYADCGVSLQALDVAPNMSDDDVERAARVALDELGAGEVLVLADVFGATPCNGALRLADGVRVRVVAGLNVPMLWRTLCYAHEPLESLVTRAVDGAKQGVLQVAVPRPQNQSSPPTSHDQIKHHHHQ